MLISPAERPVDFWHPLGETSSLPEKFGVDFLTFSPVFGMVGVQRKEISDLIASLSDGRVTREIIDMRELGVGVWLIEGKPQWSTEGLLMSNRGQRGQPFTRSAFQGVLFSLMSEGFWLITTDSREDSMNWLSSLDTWMQKPSHKGLTSRPNARSVFGSTNEKDHDVHFMKGVEGLGHTRALAIVEHYGGLPLMLKPGVNLTDVKGVGKGIAAKIERMFK